VKRFVLGTVLGTALVTTFSLPVAAADLPTPSKLFRVSQVAFVASTAIDVQSSRGLRERNVILGRGDFTVRNQGAKALAISAAVVLLENYIVRHNPSMSRVFKWVNFGMAGAHAGAAVSNYRVK